MIHAPAEAARSIRNVAGNKETQYLIEKKGGITHNNRRGLIYQTRADGRHKCRPYDEA